MTSDTKEKTDYILASDEETSRLSSQHSVIKDAMGGLLLVPVDHSGGALKVLDSGTADGTWIRDLQNTMPSRTEFVGIDIDATKFPEAPPPGTTYHTQNIKDPWPVEWNENFDIVHQRVTLAVAGPAAKSVVHGLAALVKPGGWIQLIEHENVLNDKAGPAMHDFERLMQDIFSTLGTSLTLARELAPMLREEGFLDVQERIVTLQLGALNASPELARQSAHSMNYLAEKFIEFASTLPSSSISLEPARLKTLYNDFRKELIDWGAAQSLRVVWGRKENIRIEQKDDPSEVYQ